MSSTENVRLTDEERDSIRDAAFDHFGAYPEGIYELFEALLAARLPATTDAPLPADHPAIVHALKQGHENGWNAAGSALRDMADELERSRAECRHLNDRLDEAGERIAELNRAGLGNLDAKLPSEDLASKSSLAHKAGEGQ